MRVLIEQTPDDPEAWAKSLPAEILVGCRKFLFNAVRQIGYPNTEYTFVYEEYPDTKKKSSLSSFSLKELAQEVVKRLNNET